MLEVDGGGGEDSTGEYGGYGGGIAGQVARGDHSGNGEKAGTEGTQIRGGLVTDSGYGNNVAGGFGFGGGRTTSREGKDTAGGGGGWYGGAETGFAGGGGSGWVYTEANYNTWKSGNSIDANKYLLNSSYYLTDAQTIAGNQSFPNVVGTGNETGHSGNGAAKITPIN